MRRTAFFIFILAAALQAVAQSYLPMLKDGKEWLCYSSNGVVQTIQINYNNAQEIYKIRSIYNIKK